MHSLLDASRTLKRITEVLLGVLLLTDGAAGQGSAPSEAEQIRNELRALQQDYEKRMQALEERLRQLENSSPPPAQPAPRSPATTNSNTSLTPTVPAAAPAHPTSTAPAATTNNVSRAARVREMTEREFPPGTESRDRALTYQRTPVAERVQEVLQDFVDIKGYFRAGYGRDNEGGSQVGFQAPNALAKYRLGNEAENYGELTFGKNFYIPGLFKADGAPLPDDAALGPLARVQSTISIYNPYQDLLSSGSTDFGLPEIWGSIGNVLPDQPMLKFWAGSRYYRRHDIHINDFYFYNMSGTGGGVEDFQLPFGKMALAWIGAASTSGFSDLPAPDPENQAGFSKGSWDLRLYDVPVPLGKGEFGLVYARADSGKDADGNSAPNSDGVAFTFLHTRDRLFGPDGINKFSLQFGTGSAKTFTSGFETFATPDGIFIRPDDSESWRFRATEHFTANLSEHFSIGPALLYQLTDFRDHGGRVHWASGGVRPIYHINRFFSLAGEAGADWTREETTGQSGPLYKFTFAPQLSLGNRFMSRPVIRVFVTYARWADDFVGQIGGNDYQDENWGLTYGAQMEAWW